MLPPLEEALVHPPTWVRGLGPSYHGSEPVTLVMALEEEPAGSHASMIGAHLDILVGWTTMANGLLATSEPEAPERRGPGFALLVFAAELASALQLEEYTHAVTPEQRVAATEAIAAATLAAAGCLAAMVSDYLVSVA
jgi:hypothetical protein